MTEIQEQRYRRVPQMRSYDNLGSVWHPYIMYFHTPNYSTSHVTTDNFGFRHSVFNGTKLSPINPPSSSSVSLVVGASTAFGIGAEDDTGTIASHLAELTAEPWLNLGGRAYAAFQEFALYAHFASRLPKVKTVLIVSGFNNLFLAQRSLPFELPLGAFYFQQAFEQGMQSATSGRFKRLVEIIRPNRSTPVPSRRSANEVIRLATETTCQSLELWKSVLAPAGARIIFALQPTAFWSDHKPSGAEAELFSLLERIDPNLGDAFMRLDKSLYIGYRDSLQARLAELGVDFIDLNAELPRHGVTEELTYVDRVHFTSSGYRRIAKALQQSL